MKRILIPILLLISTLVYSISSNARGVYQSKDAFLNEVFAGPPPKASVIWLTGESKKSATDILQHKPDYLRVRYWEQDNTSAWILNEIGKEQPITVGIVIVDSRIKRLSVLEFRESRGDEVRHNFFTQQFDGIQIQPDNQLNKSIDGITGATLSVRALKRLARLALYLDTYRVSRNK